MKIIEQQKKRTKGYVDGIIPFGQNALKISLGPSKEHCIRFGRNFVLIHRRSDKQQ